MVGAGCPLLNEKAAAHSPEYPPPIHIVAQGGNDMIITQPLETYLMPLAVVALTALLFWLDNRKGVK